MRSKYEYILDDLGTLSEFMEVDRITFEDTANSLAERGEELTFLIISGISPKRIIDFMVENGLKNPLIYTPEYIIEEKLYRNKINSSERISSFLNTSPEEVLVFWNPGDMGETLGLDSEEYIALMERLTGRYLKSNPWGDPEAKKDLGIPVESINFSEGPEGTRSYEHIIKMYKAKGGEKFVSWETYSGKLWMCSKSLMKNLLSSLED